MKSATCSVVLTCLAATLGATAANGAYKLTTVVDTNTQRPDGNGNFNIASSFTPSLDGSTVLILNESGSTCGGADSLWTSPASGGSWTKLVGVGQPAPGGTGNFEDLASPFGATAENGVAVFESADDAGEGVYSVPLAGGKPSLVINYKHDFPDGAQFFIGAGTCEYSMNGVSTDGAHVALAAGNYDRLLVARVGAKKVNVTESVSTAYSTGYPLSPAIEPGAQLITPISICGLFGGIGAPSEGPEISGKNLIFAGGDSGAGGNTTGLYATGLDGFVDGTYQCSGSQFEPSLYLAYYGTALPGDPNGSGNEGVGPISADGKQVAYIMWDWTDNYQCVIEENDNGGKFSPVTCSNTLLPGLTTLPVTFQSVALRDGTLAFVAEDSASNNNWGLYVLNGKKVQKVVASGDALDGGTVLSEWQGPALSVGPRATSGGNIAFFAQVDQGGNTVSGNFVAARKNR